MPNPITTYFSPENKADRLGKKLRNAVSANNQEKIVSIFSKQFMLLLREEKPQIISNLIRSYISEIKDITALEKKISSDNFKRAIGLLEENKLDFAALELCDHLGFDIEAREILAKRGQANELAMRITKRGIIDKELLHISIMCWEQYNGDVRESQTMSDILKNIAKSSIESIPDNPRAREIVGQFKEAALLYVKESDSANAARCYEKAKMYHEACKFYEDMKDGEGVSRAAEALGDLEKALKFVIYPERKIKLLIRMKKFFEAREFAAGFEHPDEYFDLIKEKAKEGIGAKIKNKDFIRAIELADVAECDPSTRENILSLGRQHFEGRIASATSKEDIESIYRDIAKLEERAGHFEEAGRIAEEVLKDLDLASSLYEKSNLFNRAIATASGKIRLAELHEKGGNLLDAARLYESAEIYGKAYALYESTQHFDKAIECYLKTTDPRRDVLIRLYTGAGEFERVVDMYMESGDFSDMEKALSIAKVHDLTSHVRVILDKIGECLSGTEGDLKRLFTRARDEMLDSYSRVFGIDFGTTNSVAAIFNKRSEKVETILTPSGSEFEPSFFGIDEDNHSILGEAARLRSLVAPHSVVARVKRSLGNGGSFSIGGKKYRSEEVVAKILQRFKHNAEAYLKSKVEARFYDLLEESNLKFPEKRLKEFLNEQKGYNCVDDVVLSVPAYFNDNQKRATRDSAEIVGLRVRRLLHEPTAAALAYGYQRRYSGRLAVVDLGGGTLDISILDVEEGLYDIQTIGGDTKLGGSDIDAEMVRYVIKDIKATLRMDIDEKSHPIEIARLRDACENLKINLSSVGEYTMELVHFLNIPGYTFTMNRTELERLSRPILDRIKTRIEETMNKNGSNVDHFLLVGNATKMPAVVKLAENTIRARHLGAIDPGTVVVTGTALEGAILSGDLAQMLLIDIVPHSLGYSTLKDNQPNVHIKVYQGESVEPHKNYFLGDFILDGIAPAPAGTPQIEVTFGIDVDCILTVSAVDKGTGNKRSIRIEGAATLSPKEKQNLSRYFTESERIHALEKDIEKVTAEIEGVKSSCPNYFTRR